MNILVSTFLIPYLKANVLLALLFGFLMVASRYELPSRLLRRMHHFSLVILIAMPVAVALLPQPDLFRPPVQIYSGASYSDVMTHEKSKAVISVGKFENRSASYQTTKWTGWLAVGLFGLVSLLFLYSNFRLVRDFFRSKNLVKGSQKFKQIGRVRVVYNSKLSTPFAFKTLLTCYVVLPESLLGQWSYFKMALTHELQHHRQKDTIWVYCLEFLRALFFINPLMHKWIDQVEEIHELTCDEALLGQQRINNQHYGRCLYDMAQLTIYGDRLLLGTAGMATSPGFLKRRISMIIQKKKTAPAWVAKISLAGLLVLTGALSYALEGSVVDRRVSMKEAKLLAQKTKTNSGVPVVVNQEVLKWLNFVAGTERGRFYARKSLMRMKSFEPMIRVRLNKANLPLELMAVPFIESGYQNYDNGTAAGIWSFTPGTARAFGLRVDDQLDERNDAELLTGAAVRYYTHLEGIFDNWYISLMAYNAGENRMKKAIKKAGHDNAFRLIRDGFIEKRETERYLPKLMAAMIVIANPELVQE